LEFEFYVVQEFDCLGMMEEYYCWWGVGIPSKIGQTVKLATRVNCVSCGFHVNCVALDPVFGNNLKR
jgi:hypothetical protein